MLPNPEGIIARASHSLSIRPVRSLDSFVSRYVQSALLIRSFVLGSMRSPIGILRGPLGVRSTDAPLRTECNRKAPLHSSAALAACGHADALRRLVSSEHLLNVEPAERMTLEQLSTEATLLMWDGSSRRSSEAFSHHAGCGSGHGSAHSQV